MLKKICLILAMTVMMCGCVRIETDLTINKDGSAVVKDRFMMSKQLLAMTQQDPFADIKKTKESPETQINPYETEDMKGFEATTNIANLENAKWNTTADTKSVKTKNPDGKFVSVKKGFIKTVYTIDAEFDGTKNADTGEKIESMQNSGADVNSIIQYNYTINTPAKADSHNAASADDVNFVYKWNIKFGEVNPLKLQFTVYNTGNIIGLLIVLAVITGAIISLLKSKKADEE